MATPSIRWQPLNPASPTCDAGNAARASQPDEAPVRARSVEDKAEKKKAKKERQRDDRAQAAAREAPNPAAGSRAAQQSPSSAQRSSPASPEPLDAQQAPTGAAQADTPAENAFLQAAEHLPLDFRVSGF